MTTSLGAELPAKVPQGSLEEVLFALLELSLLPAARYFPVPRIELQVDSGAWNLDVSRPRLLEAGQARDPALTLIAPTEVLFSLLLGGGEGEELVGQVRWRGDLSALRPLKEALAPAKTGIALRLSRS